MIFCSSKRAELEDILKIIRKLKSSNDVKTKDGEVLSELKMIEEEHDGAKQREVLEEVRKRQQCAINEFQVQVEAILSEALENVTAESGSIIKIEEN